MQISLTVLGSASTFGYYEALASESSFPSRTNLPAQVMSCVGVLIEHVLQ